MPLWPVLPLPLTVRIAGAAGKSPAAFFRPFRRLSVRLSAASCLPATGLTGRARGGNRVATPKLQEVGTISSEREEPAPLTRVRAGRSGESRTRPRARRRRGCGTGPVFRRRFETATRACVVRRASGGTGRRGKVAPATATGPGLGRPQPERSVNAKSRHDKKPPPLPGPLPAGWRRLAVKGKGASRPGRSTAAFAAAAAAAAGLAQALFAAF